MSARHAIEILGQAEVCAEQIREESLAKHRLLQHLAALHDALMMESRAELLAQLEASVEQRRKIVKFPYPVNNNAG